MGMDMVVGPRRTLSDSADYQYQALTDSVIACAAGLEVVRIRLVDRPRGPSRMVWYGMVWCPSYPLDRNRCDQVVAAGSGAS
jgi:hypothetical protein